MVAAAAAISVAATTRPSDRAALGMNLELELFAGLAERAGAPRCQVLGLPEGLTVAELKLELARRFPQWGGLEHIAVVIGTEYARANQQIQPGDSVALLPPVSGG